MRMENYGCSQRKWMDKQPICQFVCEKKLPFYRERCELSMNPNHSESVCVTIIWGVTSRDTQNHCCFPMVECSPKAWQILRMTQCFGEGMGFHHLSTCNNIFERHNKSRALTTWSRNKEENNIVEIRKERAQKKRERGGEKHHCSLDTFGRSKNVANLRVPRISLGRKMGTLKLWYL